MADSRKMDVSDLKDAEIGLDLAPDEKGVSRHVDDLGDGVQAVANAHRPNARKEAPASVACLTPEERALAEKALVRKIDFRLLPMIIVMYILNYLDRMLCPLSRLAFQMLIDSREQHRCRKASGVGNGPELDQRAVSGQFRSKHFGLRIVDRSSRPQLAFCLSVIS
jgi:hypothetical protein